MTLYRLSYTSEKMRVLQHELITSREESRTSMINRVLTLTQNKSNVHAPQFNELIAQRVDVRQDVFFIRSVGIAIVNTD